MEQSSKPDLSDDPGYQPEPGLAGTEELQGGADIHDAARLLCKRFEGAYTWARDSEPALSSFWDNLCDNSEVDHALSMLERMLERTSLHIAGRFGQSSVYEIYDQLTHRQPEKARDHHKTHLIGLMKLLIPLFKALPGGPCGRLLEDAHALGVQFQTLGSLASLNEALVCLYIASLTRGRCSEECSLQVLLQLSCLHHSRFTRLDESVDLKQSVWHGLQLILGTPLGDVEMPLRSRLLGYTCVRSQQLGMFEEFDLVMSCLRQVCSLQMDDTNKAVTLEYISSSCRENYRKTRDAAALDQEILSLSQAMALAPNSRVNNPEWLYIFGHNYMYRYEHCRGATTDLDEAITWLTQANSLVDENHPSKPEILLRMCECLMFRSEHSGDLEGLDQAIEYLSRAILWGNIRTKDKFGLLLRLGGAHYGRYSHLGDILDLECATKYHTEQLLLVPDDPMAMTLLGSCYMRRWERFGEVSDINMAIEYQLKSTSIPPPQCTQDYYNQSVILDATANSLTARFVHLGDIADLDQAIQYRLQYQSCATLCSSSKAGNLTVLGMSYRLRFTFTGKIADIDEAITQQVLAVSVAPDTFGKKYQCSSELASTYRCRFKRFGEILDIDNAIDAGLNALLLCPEDHMWRPWYLSDLGSAYGDRFKHTGRLEDIDSGIEYQLKAISLIACDHPERAEYLEELCRLCLQRFEKFCMPKDVDLAVEYGVQAISSTSEGDVRLSNRLCITGIAYRTRFQHSQNRSDIEQSIQYHDRALSLGSNAPADMPNQLISSGTSMLCRFHSFGEQADLLQSMSNFQVASISTEASPTDRFLAACQWARLARSHNKSETLAAYRTVLELLPQMAWLGMRVNQRYKEILSAGDIVSEAAMAAFNEGLYELGLEWLEQGRSIVWKQILQLRTPMDEICHADVDLANRIRKVATRLEQAGFPRQAPNTEFSLCSVSLEQATQQRRRLAQEWDTLIQRARGLPDLDDFMKPKTARELAQAAHSSDVVVLCVQDHCCIAITIRKGSQAVEQLALPAFTSAKATWASMQLNQLLSGCKVRGYERRPVYKFPQPLTTENCFKPILFTLWSDIVKPVFEHLGYLQEPRSIELPRVTWCNTGPLSFLPLHAAGDYVDPQSDARAFHYAISSYTPTLVALIPSPKQSAHFTGILTVGQSATCGESVLPGAIEELEIIAKKATGIPHTQLLNEEATSTVVLEAMQHHSWVHLACHACQNLAEPEKSAFILHNDQLQLSSIMERPVQAAGFAFLSACQTASGDKSLPDEAVHLAAGMLMAGYQTVIGTMWSIRDADAPLVAEVVYSHLLKEGVPNLQSAAAALHDATGKLRSHVGEDNLVAWVPYIHIGQ